MYRVMCLVLLSIPCFSLFLLPAAVVCLVPGTHPCPQPKAPQPETRATDKANVDKQAAFKESSRTGARERR
ncbi:hypothetical protein N24_2346 [Corynebacterium suranareeae]|uniref:Secreted protein n=1 Tax=Corynebacterium suranareeae TaxID=2506452 RepID=A0A169S167_9CORY|nr:hypothetical protein N24_2346 [Corynebacterium suranareeae]